MLNLKNITKIYKTSSFEQKALDDVSISFRNNEFVFILGESGSGKTTLLNIIGGLDNLYEGDLIINGKSTKNFKNEDFDSYRNNLLGLVFQNYNLINHLSVLENVELPLKLANVDYKKRKELALLSLKKVNLENHIYKKPNELSGGERQRVAIARAIVNNPKIITLDEPTGALDSKTSIEIMELIKEISKDKLVIMVTHNKELSKKYASRIIELQDGKIIKDTNNYNSNEKEEVLLNKKTKMKFMDALKLSLSNIKTKKGRTVLTSLASSIGIIGIALVLSLSNGFNKQIKKYEQKIFSTMPIVINKEVLNLTLDDNKKLNTYQNINYVIPRKSDSDDIIKYNNISNDYLNYIEKINKDYTYGINYVKNPNINFIYKDKNNKLFLTDNPTLNIKCIPKTSNNNNFIDIYYDILKGRLPNSKNEIVLEVDSYNKVDSNLLELLGIDFSSNVNFDEIINSNINIVFNDDLYVRNNSYWSKSINLDKLYDKSYPLKVVGIIRMKNIYPSIITSSSILYTTDFINYLLDINSSSNIIKDQEKKDFDVLTGTIFKNKEEKEKKLEYLGKNNSFSSITIYPKDFNSKEKIIKYLDKYNDDKKEHDKISYTDESKLISVMTSSIIESITIVLVFFSSISLIVSSIMIGIVTYISVLERTKEIGILRSLGARKKDISRVFNAENFIIGISSGIFGIIVTKVLIIPVNIIIKNVTSLSNVAILSFKHIIILIIISLVITLIGGLIPSKISSNKNIIDSLR